MVKIENTEVYGWEAAIRGMRNPKNSWAKSDSWYGCRSGDYGRIDSYDCEQRCKLDCAFCLGQNDKKLMQSLVRAGTDHSKFMRMITVTCDITAPMYWWSEYDTYKVGTVRNSCSKMHKLLDKPFEVSDFSFDKLAGYKNEVKQFRPIVDEDMVASEVWVYVDADYDVSNYGRVKRKLKNRYRLISGSLHSDGYVFVNIHGKQIPLHRLVAMYFHHDEYKEGLVVNHIDGNKQNNFSDNLEWVTQSENIKHSHKNGLQPKATTTYKGKFTQEQREEIKALWDSGEMSKRAIAKKYGVSHTCINDIISDKYKYADKENLFENVAKPFVDMLNELRDSYMRCETEASRKMIWYAILQLLPDSYNQRSTVQLNYEVLRNIYHARKSHKLDEWSKDFCKWVEVLPYAKELICE